MRRRLVLTLMAGGLLAGCGPRTAAPQASPSSAPAGGAAPARDEAPAHVVGAARDAVAGDYAWFQRVGELSKGFCFVWVRDVRPAQVLTRMGADELERIGWQQMVGAGDGQRGVTDKSYFGVARIADDWSLVVEDNGSLGHADDLLRPLSAGTTVVCLYRAADGGGRFLLLEDQAVRLDFDPMVGGHRSGSEATKLTPTIEAAGFGASADPAQRTAAGFALAERLTGVPLSLAQLQERTYLFSMVPTVGRKSQ